MEQEIHDLVKEIEHRFGDLMLYSPPAEDSLILIRDYLTAAALSVQAGDKVAARRSFERAEFLFRELDD